MPIKIIAVKCPRCDRWINVDKNNQLASHDGFEVQSSYVEYGPCKMSNKKLEKAFPKLCKDEEDETLPYNQS